MSTIEELKVKIIEWAKENDLWYDSKFYSNEEWRARGENMGADAPLTLTTEGPLNSVLNLHDCMGNYSYSIKMEAEFEKIVEECGFWFELGYAWTVHFYESKEAPR